VLLAVMGSPDTRQIDGLGGADPLTSKVGIVRRGESAGVDLEFLFAQVSVDRALVDTTPNCGNMLAAVVPFALERGLIAAQGDLTTVRVLTINTGVLADIAVQTPGGTITYTGDCRIDGVPGAHAPIAINFLDIAGSSCGALLPTGNVLDVIDGVAVTCIDNGMPVVIVGAASLGKTGSETRDELNTDGLGRRRGQGGAQDDARCAADEWRCDQHANVHSARVSLEHRSARCRQRCHCLRPARIRAVVHGSAAVAVEPSVGGTSHGRIQRRSRSHDERRATRSEARRAPPNCAQDLRRTRLHFFVGLA
jgi:hypothetical protein